MIKINKEEKASFFKLKEKETKNRFTKGHIERKVHRDFTEKRRGVEK